jgi:hypothetical protein
VTALCSFISLLGSLVTPASDSVTTPSPITELQSFRAGMCWVGDLAQWTSLSGKHFPGRCEDLGSNPSIREN